MNKSISLLIVIISFFTSVSAYSNSCVSRLNQARDNQSAHEVSSVSEHDLLGFEMTASMVVWNLVRENKIAGVALTEAEQDKDAIYNSLSPDQKTDINQKVQIAFAAIFNRADTRGQVGYVVMSQRDPKGFNFDVLSSLFRSNENLVFDFLKENMEAILFNGRRMVPMSLLSKSDLWTRVTTPIPLRRRAVRFWKGAFSLSMLGGLVLPHANLKYAMDRCLNGECEEFYYIFHESFTYLNDSFMYMMLESLNPMAWTAAGFGTIFLISKKFSEFRGTRNSPRFDLVNYNTDIGFDTRMSFAEGLSTSDEVPDIPFVRRGQSPVAVDSNFVEQPARSFDNDDLDDDYDGPF